MRDESIVSLLSPTDFVTASLAKEKGVGVVHVALQMALAYLSVVVGDVTEDDHPTSSSTGLTACVMKALSVFFPRLIL